jgi:precorrin-6A/cobalt-precorrin-6A reductase
MPNRVLVLGGTRDARMICNTLHDQGNDVTLSLAGVTENPEPVRCAVRRGGFGGAVGLRDYLLREKISVLIDATHPFAAQISRNAAAAVQGSGIMHFRLDRPAWRKNPAAHWISARNYEDAASLLPSGACVFLTIGRKEIAPFLERPDISGILRMIEPPAQTIPPSWLLIRARPPSAVEPEIELMNAHGITHLVTKNAGGPNNQKLKAAERLSIPILMIGRPKKTGGKTFTSLEALCAEVDKCL